MMLDEKPLERARKALESAKLSAFRMRAAPTTGDREHDWRSFLNFIAQVLEKLTNGYKGAGGAVEPWIGQQRRIRDDDELLCYVFHARHADTHTNQDSVEITPGQYTFTLGGGGKDVYVESLATGPDGRVVHYKGNVAPEITDIPPSVDVMPVVNRGRRYDPPSTHLGQPFTSRDPMQLASAAIQHYERMLIAFRAHFLGTGPTSTVTPRRRS